MDFLIKLNKKHIKDIEYLYINDLSTIPFNTEKLYIEKLPHLDYKVLDGEKQVFLLGDIIAYDEKDEENNKGFFYRIVWDKNYHKLEFYSDYSNFLPIYYCELEDLYIISSSIHTLNMLIKSYYFKPNPLFITQIAMLNAPFKEECFFKIIKKLNYGSYLLIDNEGLQCIQSKQFYDLFTDRPRSYKKALNDIVDLFIKECSKYLDKPAYISLTGGFDGRAITSIAHYYENDFKTYSYGKSENYDVYIPLQIANKLGFDHTVIYLDDNYVQNYYEYFVNQFLKYSGGMNGFLYPTFLYTSYYLSRNNRPLVTGFVGSELLRNAHCAGAITSQFILDLLKKGKDYAINNYISNPNLSIFVDNLDTNAIIETAESVSYYFNCLPEELSLNQKLAVFEFEEIIPKHFGISVYAGLHYNRVRSPFIDTSFLLSISKTQISQFYRKFLEQNPLKRFWGQYFYAVIIDRTWPQLGKEISAKQYAPADLLSFSGRLRILKGYYKKEQKKKNANFDNLSLISGMQSYLSKNKSLSKYIKPNNNIVSQLSRNENKRDYLFLLLSNIQYNNILNNIT